MTITDISQKVASLAEAHRELTKRALLKTMSLIARLRKLERIGPDTTGSEITALIHQNLKESEQDLELLLTQIEDEPAGEQKTSLMTKWHKLSEDTKIARVSYRKAQMEAKRNAEALRRKERERLLGNGPDGKRKGRNDKLSQDELLVNASSDITSSLKRTHSLLSSELSRSQFASETLSASTLALRDLSTRYSTLDDVLLKSRRLITDLVRKNKSDSWYYEKAIYIMVTTLVWLIIRRFLYGPFYLLIWLPLKLCWWVLSGVGVVIGAGSGHNSELIGKEISSGGVGQQDTTIGGRKDLIIKGTPEDLPTIPAFVQPVQSQEGVITPTEVGEREHVLDRTAVDVDLKHDEL